MKASKVLAIAMSLASSAVWAQSGYSVPIPATAPPANQMPAPGMQRGVGASEGQQSSDTMDHTQSSGASAQGAEQAGSSGQLITPSIVQSRPVARMSSAPVQPRSEGDVTYLCGGIGDEETNYMKQTAAGDYDVMMTFAAQSGNYLANVGVKIADARGNTILNTTCDAPLMLVDLPRAGSYRIQADVNGHQISRNVSVGAKAQTSRVVFAWPRNAVAADRVADTEQTGSRVQSSGTDEMRGASGRSSERPMDTPPGSEVIRPRSSGAGATGNSGSGNGNGTTGSNADEPTSTGTPGSPNGSRPYDSPTKGMR